MKNINLFIKENVKTIGNDAYITPDIPEKKLNNAIKAFNCEDFYESILAIYDNTIFGSAKEGLVFTGEKMIYNNGKLQEFIYSDIKSVEYKKDVTVNEKGKESVKEYTIITTNDQKNHKLTGLMSGDFNYKNFTTLLDKIITEFDDYKEEKQLTPLSEMSAKLKISYLKTIINMTFIDDEKIDEKELAELFSLMTLLELNENTRFEVRAYITEISKENIQSIESLLDIIKNESEASNYKSIMISLAKDLINVYFSTKDTTNRDFKFLDENKILFELSDEEIDLAYATIENDYKLLNEDLDDDAIRKNAKKLASTAAAAGAPLAAVYISGSVIGMSAAGMTSGLATLGMGMGMTGGLAVIGIIGVLSYKGVQHLTGANELDKYKTRELMLHDVIKQTQKTISLIIKDVNFIVQKLNATEWSQKELESDNENIKKLLIRKNAENKKIRKILNSSQGALTIINNKSNQYQNSVNRLHSPRILDVERLKSLTDEPTKKLLYDFIIVNYEERLVLDDGNKIKAMALQENIQTEVLEEMSDTFKALGYFDMDNILKSKATEGFNSLKKGIFG
jgi:hypothetical protein